MESDVIAYIYAAAGESNYRSTIAIIDNLRKARNTNDNTDGGPEIDKKGSADDLDPRARDDDSQSQSDMWKRGYFYEIRFRYQPRTKEGFVFGTHENADFVLPDSGSVSAHHFALTFDQKYELIVRDGSTFGTEVIYDEAHLRNWREEKKADGQVRARDWSARGPEMAEGFHPIIIVNKKLRFRIVVPNHDTKHEEYRRKVAKYREGRSADQLFAEIAIESVPPTIAATPADTKTPKPGHRFWKKRIGEGGFGTVYYAWDVTTRDEYAMKIPRQRRDFSGQVWENELKIIKSLKHPHIIRLLKSDPEPNRRLFFEYAPGGSLEGYVSTSSGFQNKQVAFQILDALKFLHGRGMPIAHRDIKPDNVLVSEWTRDKIHVKLGDFGFAKSEEEINNSRLGTEKFWAPEIISPPKGSTYGCQVDIWSLGVLLLNMECGGLPPLQGMKMPEWAHEIINFGENYVKQNRDTPVLEFALKYMLKIDPTERWTAAECFRMATQLFGVRTAEKSMDPQAMSSLGRDNRSGNTTPRAISGQGDAEPTLRVADFSTKQPSARPAVLASMELGGPGQRKRERSDNKDRETSGHESQGQRPKEAQLASKRNRLK